MKKRIVSLFLAFTMLLSLMPSFGTVASATTTWYSSGDGSAENPYIISDVDGLTGFANAVNGGNGFAGNTIKLADNFDNTKALATPIGKSGRTFKGTFDGNGKTVELNISGFDYAGLFGYIEGGTVQNVSTSGSVVAQGNYSSAGGVVGCNYGTVVNCSSVSKISNARNAGGVAGYSKGTVTNCYAAATVSAMVGAGGVIGFNAGTLTNCYASGTISGSYPGGVVGYNDGPMSNCYCPNNMGILNENYSTVTNCSAFDKTTLKLTGSDKTVVDALNEYVEQNPTEKGVARLQWDSVDGSYPLFKIAYQTPVYVDATDVTKGITGFRAQSCTNYTEMTADSATWGTLGAETWYVVNQNVTITSRVVVQGKVHLILMDGCTLNAQKGILVSRTNGLTIYGQSADANKMGKLNTTGEVNQAGIGGNSLEDGNNITINGGYITARGNSNGGSAGIGGGKNTSASNIVINGGVVKAYGGWQGSGIGGGWSGRNPVRNITINGGNVTAQGSGGAAGIGSGESSTTILSSIIINAGIVKAIGGRRNDGTFGTSIGFGTRSNGTASNIKVAVGLTLVADGNATPSTIITPRGEDVFNALKGTQYAEIFRHDHVWSYELTEADTITLSCTDPEYRHVGASSFPLRLEASDTVYNGQPVTASPNEAQAQTWTNAGATLPMIYYIGRDGTKYARSKNAPVNAGKYTAIMRAGVKTASVDFEITKQTWETKPTVSVEAYDFGGTVSTPSNSIGITEGVTYYYNQVKSNLGGTAWSELTASTLPHGTYYVYAVFAENGNMDSCTTEAFPFTVNHVHQYTLVKSDTQDSVIATCTHKDDPCEGDVHSITLKTADAVYTGQPYEPDGVAQFAEETGKQVTVVYSKEDGTQLESAPTDAGSYKATLTVPNEGGESISVEANFQIVAKTIEKPTASTKTYTYNPRNAQTYVFDTVGDEEAYTVTGNKQTDVGEYTVTVTLKNAENLQWSDGTTDALTFEFTIEKKTVAKPTAVEKSYIYSGAEQSYAMDNTADADYYAVTGNKQTNAGTQTVTVTLKDTENMEWSDGTTDALTFDFTIAKKSVTKPTAVEQSYTYSGAEQSYAMDNTADADYYAVTGNKQTNAGTQTVTVTLKDAENTEWSDGTTDALTFDFTIAKKSITKPTASTRSYSYSGGEHSYAMGDTADNAWYTVTGNKRTNAGTQTVTVALKDAENTEWSDGTNEDLTFDFTILPMRIENPIGDPRTFVANGQMQNFLVLYRIDNYYYNLKDFFYRVTGDQRSEAGTQTVSVTPTENFAWADGSQSALSFDFTIKQKQMNARIYYLMENQTNSLTSYYVYGRYTEDLENPSNCYVKNFYTPYIYNLPEGATYTFYVCTNPYTKANSIKWDDLTFKTLSFGNSLAQRSTTYYIYAKVQAPGYADYETPITYCSSFQVCQPTVMIYSCKNFTYQERVKHESWRRFYTCWYSNETRTSLKDIRTQSFVSYTDAMDAIVKDLQNGCVRVDLMWYTNPTGYSSYVGGSGIQKAQANKAHYLSTYSLTSSSVSYDALLPQVEQIDLDLLAQLNVNSEDAILHGDSFDAKLTPNTVNFPDMTFISQMQEQYESHEDCTVTFDLGYFTFEDENDPQFKKGNFSEEVTCAYGTSVEAIKDPVRSGYTFAGWYVLPIETSNGTTELSAEKNGVKWDFEDKVFDNMTLFAKWEEVVYEKKSVQFVDVASDAYYYDAVQWAVENTITTGTDETHFSPEAITTRAQMVTFLWRTAGCPEANATQSVFVDVVADSYYEKAVLWAVEKGITTGTSATTFSPDKTVTRAEVATFLYRADGNKFVGTTNPFADVHAKDYYYEAVLWAFDRNITNGISHTTFGSGDACTRGQVVTFLYRNFVK